MNRDNAETHSQTGPPEDILLPRWMVERLLDQADAPRRMEAMIQRLHADHLQAQASRASLMGLVRRWATEKTLLILGILGLMILSLPAEKLGALFSAALAAAFGLM